MKQLGSLAPIALLGLLASAALPGCGGGGDGGGGRMYVLSCVLGCNNGSGGQQVSCGIVNTYRNQDLAFQFSEPVDLAWVEANTTSFLVIDDQTGNTPFGDFLLDPGDKKRLIWRPSLTFSPAGAPSFSLQDGGVYRIEIAGTAAGSAGPFVQSVDGKRNESRVLCTINTTLGINDPIPGRPSVSMFVDEIDPFTGQITTKEIGSVTGQVASTSNITLVFDDIMNVGTVVTPSTLTAPFITVHIDPDGNISDPSDQVPVAGVWSIDWDDVRLTTTAVFHPTGGLPSGGTGQRKVVVNIPPQVIDLADNSVLNGGLKVFTPEVQIFNTLTIPTGGEQFLDQTALDTLRSGADWGESVPGRLLPGQGGGSGRLGDLVVAAGQSLVLQTSPQRASLSIVFTGPITAVGSTLVIGDPLAPTTFSYKNVPAGPYDIKRRNTFTSHVLAETATFLNNFVAPDPLNVPQDLVIEQATYTVDGDRLVITWDVPGAVGNGAFFIDPQFSSGPYVIANTLTSGGVDALSFGGPGQIGEGQLVTNFDFQANPAGTPPPFTVDDGVLEFARVLISTNATLALVGDEPGRIHARGRFELQSQGLIAAAGTSRAPHLSNAPLGQLGGPPGPGGGGGGAGADRPDNTGSDLLTLPSPNTNGGIENPGSVTTVGQPGVGVGGGGVAGAGQGGVRFPNVFPTQTNLPGELEMNPSCVSEQVAGPGSGGAYATSGGPGLPVAVSPSAIPDMIGNLGPSNTPANTSGGNAAQVGLPAPGVLPVGARSLDPDAGFLRGGAGGGGGGASVEGTATTPNPGGNIPGQEKPDCVTLPAVANPPTPIVIYRSHSGGSGGGGGGAIQVQAGREAAINGVIDVSGGSGGSADAGAAVNAARATPGGGGGGGAVLIQALFVNMAPVPNRLLVKGGLGGTLFDPGLATDLSTGGDGGVGLVRAESVIANPAFFDEVAGAIDPFDNTVVNQQDPGNPLAAIHWLSVDTWNAETTLPGAFSAGQSCWYKPVGNFLALTFQDDTQGFGWDMDLSLDIGAGTQLTAYRNSTFFAGNSPQVHWGELYAENGNPGAPLVVRFQGAKSTGAILDPCNIDPSAPGSPIDPASLTEWVRHPSELNAFQPKPDMVRFLILFDASDPEFAFVQGVTNLRIQADPN